MEEQKALDLEKLEEDRTNQLISLENYELQKKLIESKYAQDSKKITQDVDAFKLQSRAQVLSGLASLFGQESALGKVFASAQIINDTVTNASKAFTQAAVFASNPLTAALAPNAYIQGGIIVATGAAQLAKLIAPKTKGYATGGIVSGGFEISRSNGDNRLITAKDGEVILNENQQNALGGAPIFRMLGVPGFATGGVVGASASKMSSVQNSIVNNFNLEALTSSIFEAVMEGSAIGTRSGSQSGIVGLSENRIIANGANF